MIADFTPGYPADLRSDARRKHLAAGPVGDFEGMAARIVARLTGERVVIQDDGRRSSVPDIRIDYPDKPSAYIEVVVDIESSYAAMAAEIWTSEPIPAVMVWKVHVTGQSPKLKQLRRELPEILGRLHDSPGPQETQQLARMGLRVLGPWEPGPNRPAGIHLGPEGVFGSAALAWEPFLEWIESFLASSQRMDVLGKLTATGAPERHAFLGASFTSPGDAYFALSREGRPELPPCPPRLPPEITHLWVASAHGHGRCLAWFPDAGWFDVMNRWATP